MLETKDLILRKAVFDDWHDMYENVWSRKETARYMFWTVTCSEEDAKDRMERTIMFQQNNPHSYIICEKASGRVIGFAGMREVEAGVYEETGIAIGPEFVGRGYGKQILTALVEKAFSELNGERFHSCCRSANEASRRLQRSCGFVFSHTEDCVDKRDGSAYVLEHYELRRKNTGG